MFNTLNPNIIKKLPANVEGRDFIIGDAHGCYDEIVALLKHVNFNPDYDRLFSTGDLIDRGPKVLHTIDFLTNPWFHAVLGNHEDMFLSKIKMIKNNEKHNMSNEEIRYIESIYPYSKYIQQLPLIIEVEHLIYGKYYITHGEILPEHFYSHKDLNLNNAVIYKDLLNRLLKEDFSETLSYFLEQSEEILTDNPLRQKILWSRKIYNFFYEKHKNSILKADFSFLKHDYVSQELKIFCGHNIVPMPMKIGQQYYLDTGAALGYSDKNKNIQVFTQLGHEFFGLSLIEVDTGSVYNCITNPNLRFKIVKMSRSIYDVYS